MSKGKDQGERVILYGSVFVCVCVCENENLHQNYITIDWRTS